MLLVPLMIMAQCLFMTLDKVYIIIANNSYALTETCYIIFQTQIDLLIEIIDNE